MKKIKLTQKKFVLIDNEDYELISKYKWHTTTNNNIIFYVKHSYQDEKTKKIKNILMHRLIMKIIDPKTHVDHVNSNGLDNRKHNLRICTPAQNQMNQIKIRGRSKYKGVSWHKHGKKWQVSIQIGKKRKHLGYFHNEIEAAKAYDTAARLYFGEFARLNFDGEVR